MFMFCLFLSSSGPGMDILNGAIDSLTGSSNKEDWTPVALNVADATVTISKDKVGHTTNVACFLEIEIHKFLYIVSLLPCKRKLI